MSKTDVELSQMDRDDLEAEVANLRERVDELESIIHDALGPGVARVLNDLADERDETDADAGASYQEPRFVAVGAQASTRLKDQFGRIDDLEATMQRHESVIQEGQAVASDAQGQHWQAVVELADNVKEKPRHSMTGSWVALYKEDIGNATGLSDRRAGQLIDEWTAEDSEKYKQGTRKQPYEPPSAGTNGSVQKKAIMLDLDVWGGET